MEWSTEGRRVHSGNHAVGKTNETRCNIYSTYFPRLCKYVGNRKNCYRKTVFLNIGQAATAWSLTGSSDESTIMTQHLVG